MNAPKFWKYMAKKSVLNFFCKGNNLKEVKPTPYHDIIDHKLLFRPSYVLWKKWRFEFLIETLFLNINLAIQECLLPCYILGKKITQFIFKNSFILKDDKSTILTIKYAFKMFKQSHL